MALIKIPDTELFINPEEIIMIGMTDGDLIITFRTSQGIIIRDKKSQKPIMNWVNQEWRQAHEYV